jgi:peptidase C39-like protein
MTASTLTAPHEKPDAPASRGCGAACLSMIYKSFGKAIPEAEIWPLIAKPNRFGSVSSTTHLMTRHAIGQGFSSVAIEARHPIQVLRLCRETGIRAILNHRVHPGASSGHYSVLADIDGKNVVVHDPLWSAVPGAVRRMSHAELLHLWQPLSSDSEILGNVIIGISRGATDVTCEFCHTAIPSKVDCPRCQKAVGLEPGAMLGCIRDGCIARMWNCVCCPFCDFLWSFNEAGPSTGESPRPAAAAPVARTVNFEKLFTEVDKFCAYALAQRGTADHIELRQQLDFLAGTKERVLLAQAEATTRIKTRQDKLDASRDSMKEKEAARRREAEERNKPLPPLDGKAIACALLKNLGFE